MTGNDCPFLIQSTAKDGLAFIGSAGQEVTDKLYGEDDDQNQDGRDESYVFAASLEPVQERERSEPSSADDACHGSIAN